MACTERFEIRLTPEDRQHLRELAQDAQRSEGDTLRVLMRLAASGQLTVDPTLPIKDEPLAKAA